MCNQKHANARLNSLAPTFPEALADVHALWARKPRTIGDHLRELTSRLGTSEPVTIELGPTTSDGYEWYAGLTFHGEGYSATMLLPGCESYANKDGTTSDRMSALYVKGDCDEATLDALVRNVAAAFADIAAHKRIAA